MVRDHNNNAHNVRLEWIVIWLIVVEVRRMPHVPCSLSGAVDCKIHPSIRMAGG